MTTLRIARTIASVLCASVLCISCLCGIVAADGKDSRDGSAGHLQWVGDWEMSAEVNRILGFANAEDRRDATWEHPTSFRLSFDKEISEQLQLRTPNVRAFAFSTLTTVREEEGGDVRTFGDGERAEFDAPQIVFESSQRCGRLPWVSSAE